MRKGRYQLVAPALLSLSAAGAGGQFESLAPFMNDMQAAEAGQRIGTGVAALEGPDTVEVFTHQTWTLVYTAGKAGIRPGGGIRIAMRHSLHWTPPQTEDAKAVGYLTVRTTPEVPASVYIEYNNHRGRFFQRYHPWQNIVEITLPDAGLSEGDCIRVTYGDRTGGSSGIRIQPFDEPEFTFKVYADPLGTDAYYPLVDNPMVNIVAAEPYRLGVVMPSDAVAGEPTWCVVRAEDRYGNPAAKYRGTIRLSSSDASAKLPEAYTFTEVDRGVHRFENVTFSVPGDYTITAGDTTFERTGNPVRVTAEQPPLLLLWGDIHGHTLHSDGRGTVEQYYDFAERVAGLDFCAVTDHAFEMIDEMWAHSKTATNRANRPGRFVTFNAYEWSGQSDVGGDHNVYFLDDDPPLYRSRSYYNYRNFQMYHGPQPQLNHIEDLFALLAGRLGHKDIFAIPHYGGRQGNPAWHNPRVQRMIEVFSEHRRSEDWATQFLKNRYRLGIMASSDGHYGNPGHGYLKPTYDWTKQEIGMAAVAVYARQRTRESIFRALYDRHAYATSGDRIILDVRADGHVMGWEYPARQAPTIAVHAVGTAPITLVEIKKDSETVHTVEPGQVSVRFDWRDPAFDAGRECYYYVRIVQADNEEAISSPIWLDPGAAQVTEN